jgi:hypothetical protein
MFLAVSGIGDVDGERGLSGLLGGGTVPMTALWPL